MRIEENVKLAPLTTFRIGGRARFFIKIKKEDELRNAFEFTKSKKLPIFVLGGGSNVLISDKGFPGVVIQLQNKKIVFSSLKKSCLVKADAGVIWDDLVEKTVKRNLQGIECLSGIPGTVGAAPVQNIGAYGQELKDVFVSLKAFDTKKEKFVIMNKKDCKFSYRQSVFKKENARFVIINITLKLFKNKKPTLTYESLVNFLKEKGIKKPSLQDARKAVLMLRSQRLEDYQGHGNAGSFFKNPVVSKKFFLSLKEKYPDIPFFFTEDKKVKLFAGWLIEQAGWKGKVYGNVGVSDKNALVLLNRNGKGKAREVKRLANLIQKDVKKKFGVILEPEVCYISF